jgi:hypothetical protein
MRRSAEQHLAGGDGAVGILLFRASGHGSARLYFLLCFALRFFSTYTPFLLHFGMYM